MCNGGGLAQGIARGCRVGLVGNDGQALDDSEALLVVGPALDEQVRVQALPRHTQADTAGQRGTRRQVTVRESRTLSVLSPSPSPPFSTAPFPVAPPIGPQQALVLHPPNQTRPRPHATAGAGGAVMISIRPRTTGPRRPASPG